MKNTTFSLLGLALLPLLLGLSPQSRAGNQTGTLKPSASVSNVCLISSTDNLNFGPYQPNSGAALQTSGQVKLTCTKGATATALPISGGSAMSGGGSSLVYSLYTSTALSNQWGSPVTLYQNINVTNNLYFTSVTTNTSISDCISRAAGFVYAYTAAYTNGTSFPSYCYTGYSATATSTRISGISGANHWSGLTVNGSQKQAPYANGDPMIYLPTGTTFVSGNTYSAPTSKGSQAALSGIASSVSTPVVLTYYGQVPAKQDVPPGTYVDTVTVQVAF